MSDSSKLGTSILLTMKETSDGEIYDTLEKSALISKSVGGIGMFVSSIKESNELMTRGAVVPMIKVYNDTQVSYLINLF